MLNMLDLAALANEYAEPKDFDALVQLKKKPKRVYRASKQGRRTRRNHRANQPYDNDPYSMDNCGAGPPIGQY